MTTAELRALINQGEDSRTQLKRQFNGVDAVASEIAAMLNSEGGKIIVGVSDQGEVFGVDRLGELNQWISNACSQKIEPPASVITENLKVDEKLVVVISVAIGADKPYAVDKTAFWVKVGADKRRATREELRRLMQASGVSYADEMPLAHTKLDDFDQLRFRLFFEEQYGDKVEAYNPVSERILSNLKLMRHPNLTLAGLLLFGAEPSADSTTIHRKGGCVLMVTVPPERHIWIARTSDLQFLNSSGTRWGSYAVICTNCSKVKISILLASGRFPK